jgi:hypothetical protein
MDYRSVSNQYLAQLKIPLEGGGLVDIRGRFATPLGNVAHRILCLHIISRPGIQSANTCGFPRRDPTKPCAKVTRVAGDIRSYGEVHASRNGRFGRTGRRVFLSGITGWWHGQTAPPLGLEWVVGTPFRPFDPMRPVYHVRSREEYPATLAARTATLAFVGWRG